MQTEVSGDNGNNNFLLFQLPIFGDEYRKFLELLETPKAMITTT